MSTTSKAKMAIIIRRKRTKDLALQGLTRKQIQNELGVSYQTVSTDLKLLNITPVSPYKTKENA